MQKSYAHVVLLFFFVLMSVVALQGMEVTIDSQQIRWIQSLQDLCIECIARNAQTLNLVDNLIYLPAQCAVKAVHGFFWDENHDYVIHNWMETDESRLKLVELVKSYTLDKDVSCAIVQKLKDLELAFALAKQQGMITQDAASVIVDAFLETDLKTCLGDFDTTFAKAFPAEILEHGNYGALYKKLMGKCTIKSFKVDAEVNEDVSLSIAYPYIDLGFDKARHWYKKQLEFIAATPCFEYISYNVDDLCTGFVMGYIALSPCKRFLAVLKHKDLLSIDIYNLKMMQKMRIRIQCGVVIERLAFNQDFPSLDFLGSDGKIYTIKVPTLLLNNELSLQQLAMFVYCCRRMNRALDYKEELTSDRLKSLLFPKRYEKEDQQKLLAVFEFAAEKVKTGFLPSFLGEPLLGNKTYPGLVLSGFLKRLAEKLSISKKEALKMFFNPEDYSRITEWVNNDLSLDEAHKLSQSFQFLVRDLMEIHAQEHNQQ